MLKSSGGGGGIGMRVCHSAAELAEAYESVLRLSKANFGDTGVYLENYVARARHIEVQIFGDGKGNVIALGERDCSAQRRHQKVLEETPAPGLTAATREQLYANRPSCSARRSTTPRPAPSSSSTTTTPPSSTSSKSTRGCRSSMASPSRSPASTSSSGWCSRPRAISLRSTLSSISPRAPRLRRASTPKIPRRTSSHRPASSRWCSFLRRSSPAWRPGSSRARRSRRSTIR